MMIMIILHIQVSLGTKFQPKLTIFNFLTKFSQKGLFPVKMEKITLVKNHPWLLLTILNFTAWGLTDTMVS